MIKAVEENIIKHNMILAGDEVVAGVSGGADSVCMLMQLLAYKKKVDYTLKVVHINHLIREDAGLDAQFVKELCQKHNVECHVFEEDVERQAKELGMSTEEAGRRVRYMRLAQVMSSPEGKIAVAHNRGDVAETVLFNIFRGTGVEGLASLLPVNGNIIRPVIVLTRNQIEDYIKKNGLSYRTDSTNATTAYARNKIRNVILPYAEDNIVKEATSHVAALSDKMALVRDYIEEETDKAFDKVAKVCKDEVVFDLKELKGLKELIRQEVILKAFDLLTSGRKDIGQVHVDAVISLLDLEGEKKSDLPYHMEAVKQYENLIIRKKSEKCDPQGKTDVTLIDGQLLVGSVDIGGGKTLKIRIFERELTSVIEQNPYTKWFDYDKINECLTLRNRQAGDYLTVNDKLQKKSLKDYMIDSKIPKEMREKQLVIADGSHILWVVGYRISEYYKITEETKRIIEISIN